MFTGEPQTIDRPSHLESYDLSPLSAQSRIVRPTTPTDAEAIALLRPVQKRPGSAAMSAVFIIALGASLFVLSYQRNLVIGELAAIAMTPLALFGLFRGAIRKTFILIALASAVYVAAGLQVWLEPQVRKFAPTSSGWLSYIFAGLILIVGVFIVAGIGKRLRRRLESLPAFYSMDRWLGAMIGAAEGALIVLSVCWVSTLLRPQAVRLRDQAAQPIDSFRAQFSGNLIRIADETSAAPFSDFVRRTNPIEKMPALKDAIKQLNETGQLNLPGLDPAIAEKLRAIMNPDPNAPPPDINKTIDELKKAIEEQHKSERQ